MCLKETTQLSATFALLACIINHALATKGFGKPQMGFNNCNIDCCSDLMPNASFLLATAELFVTTGLKDAGYTHINMDDCWMQETRSTQGLQVPIVAKFPDGIAPVADRIHELGLTFGLYTAQASSTCGGKAGSCGHEAVDAVQFVRWGVDYLKYDQCGGCPASSSANDIHTIGRMQQALNGLNRTVFLSSEGNPNISMVSARPDLFGNTHRVAHDITPNWGSMITEVDIASGLWSFAHNDSGYGGFFNDLDMLQIGNAGDFLDSPEMIRTHFTMWVMLKSTLLIGTRIAQLSNATLQLLKNPEALAIHQDAWGKQARRVASATPNGVDLVAPFSAWVGLRHCETGNPLQQWHHDASGNGRLWTIDTSGRRWCVASSVGPSWANPTFAVPCNDPQVAAWTASQPTCKAPYPEPQYCNSLRLGGVIGEGPGCKLTLQCNPGQVITSVDVDWGLPDVDLSKCRVTSNSSCSARKLASDLGNRLCVGRNSCTLDTSQFRVLHDPCSGVSKRLAVSSVGCDSAPPTPGISRVVFSSNSSSLGYDNTQYASGPLPHSRYSFTTSPFVWGKCDANGKGCQLKPAPYDDWDILQDEPWQAGGMIVDEDHVGGTALLQADSWCLEVMRGGNLETWVAELSGGRFAVALLNRLPTPESLTAQWESFGQPKTKPFVVRDVWATLDAGVHQGSYTVAVAAHSVALLVLTPHEMLSFV